MYSDVTLVQMFKGSNLVEVQNGVNIWIASNKENITSVDKIIQSESMTTVTVKDKKGKTEKIVPVWNITVTVIYTTPEPDDENDLDDPDDPDGIDGEALGEAERTEYPVGRVTKISRKRKK